MSDRDRRALERAAAAGDPGAGARVLADRLRSGEVSHGAVYRAAVLGLEEARVLKPSTGVRRRGGTGEATWAEVGADRRRLALLLARGKQRWLALGVVALAWEHALGGARGGGSPVVEVARVALRVARCRLERGSTPCVGCLRAACRMPRPPQRDRVATDLYRAAVVMELGTDENVSDPQAARGSWGDVGRLLESALGSLPEASVREGAIRWARLELYSGGHGCGTEPGSPFPSLAPPGGSPG